MSLSLQLKYVTTNVACVLCGRKSVAYVVDILWFSFCSRGHCHLVVTLVFAYRYSFNLLTPKDHYSARTALLTSKRCILYIYSTNIGTEYFKHGIHSPFFFCSKCSLFHNSNIFGSCFIHILYTGCAKI